MELLAMGIAGIIIGLCFGYVVGYERGKGVKNNKGGKRWTKNCWQRLL